MGSASTEDLVVFQGNRVHRPDRQPILPPPAERQKDEGFVRFLKKHSSPTHNRVTAGGRIVPMEPRSPPVFSLPTNVTNRPKGVLADQEAQHIKPDGDNEWSFTSRKVNEHGVHGTNHISAEPRVHNAPPRSDVDGMNQISMLNPDNLYGSPYLPHVTLNASVPPVLIPSPHQMQYPAQHVGSPLMQASSYNHQFGIGGYQHHPNMASALGTRYNNQYAASSAWNMNEQSFAYQLPSHQTMSAQQQLAAWEQHYADLDVQLKNIDRHRAMHQLDPYLAEQRRVIVQQRSDAKDTIREYQSMLGLKRMTDSSQESFATGFNVDAPVYVPTKGLGNTGVLSHQGSLPTMREEPPVFKPKSSVGCKAIPIKPPPDTIQRNNEPYSTEAPAFGEQKSLEVDAWGVQTRNAPPEIKREQSELSAMIEASLKLKEHETSREVQATEISHGHPGETMDEQRYQNTDGDIMSTQITNIIPPRDDVPLSREDELQQIGDAISRPKGITTKIRLLDDRVIDVDGQGLLIPSSPLPDSTWGQNDRSGHGSLRVGTLGKHQFTRNSSTPFDQVAVTDRYVLMTTKNVLVLTSYSSSNKENVFTSLRGHRKAATDAFLSHINTMDDGMALNTKPETRSLRDTSNGCINQDDYQAPGYLQPALIRHANSFQMQLPSNLDFEQPVIGKHDSNTATMTVPVSPDDFSHKGYSSVSIQNVHAVGRLPHNFDGSVDARQSAQVQLAAAEKARSPRLLRRNGVNGGAAWYGPHCREVFERALLQNKSGRPAKPYLP